MSELEARTLGLHPRRVLVIETPDGDVELYQWPWRPVPLRIGAENVRPFIPWKPP